MLPSVMGTHKRDGILPSIQEWDKVPETHNEWVRVEERDDLGRATNVMHVHCAKHSAG